MWRDHPRVCGEKACMFVNTCAVLGSPPRVRGKAVCKVEQLHGFGITPACAGKRRQAVAGTAAPRDHPRVCGEKMQTTIDVWTYQGSPPRVRGKVSIFRKPFGVLRITPACAGKSFSHLV